MSDFIVLNIKMTSLLVEDEDETKNTKSEMMVFVPVDLANEIDDRIEMKFQIKVAKCSMEQMAERCKNSTKQIFVAKQHENPQIATKRQRTE